MLVVINNINNNICSVVKKINNINNNVSIKLGNSMKFHILLIH